MGGHKGDSFLKIYILGIFGDISSNLSLDRCQKPPQKLFDSQGCQVGQGASNQGGQLGEGAVFLKSAFLVFLVIFRRT